MFLVFYADEPRDMLEQFKELVRREHEWFGHQKKRPSATKREKELADEYQHRIWLLSCMISDATIRPRAEAIRFKDGDNPHPSEAAA